MPEPFLVDPGGGCGGNGQSNGLHNVLFRKSWQLIGLVSHIDPGDPEAPEPAPLSALNIFECSSG